MSRRCVSYIVIPAYWDRTGRSFCDRLSGNIRSPFVSSWSVILSRAMLAARRILARSRVMPAVGPIDTKIYTWHTIVKGASETRQAGPNLCLHQCIVSLQALWQALVAMVTKDFRMRAFGHMLDQCIHCCS